MLIHAHFSGVFCAVLLVKSLFVVNVWLTALGFLTHDLVASESAGEQQKYLGVCRLGNNRKVMASMLERAMLV